MGFKHNYLIGLGGTGGEAVKAFQEIAIARRDEHRKLLEHGRQFEYLYIDSNEVDISNAEKWEHLDQNMNLVKGMNTLLISNDGGGDVDALCQLPQVTPWIGKEGASTVRTGLQSRSIQGAGQRRRYGRLLAASKAEEIREAIGMGIGELANERAAAQEGFKITFHIFATLGGGTGSGSIVDVLTLIPTLCRPMGIEYKIVAYLFVGGGKVKASTMGYFFQNEYTALRDINGLMANRYCPFMAFRAGAERAFHSVANPIDAVYISTEERGVPLMAQIKRFAAGCYDLISFVPDANSNAGRAFSGEDLYPTNPGESSAVVYDQIDKKLKVEQRRPLRDGINDVMERSYRFQTLSSVRAKHPSEELRGILACALGRKVVERWLDGDILARKERDKTVEQNLDIFDYHKRADEVLFGELDQAYRERILRQYDDYIEEIEGKGYESLTLSNILQKTKSVCYSVLSTVKEEIKPIPGMETDLERICRRQAENDRQAILEVLEGRRKWIQGTRRQGSVWGVRDMITYLHNMQAYLRDIGTSGVPEIPSDTGNMGLRAAEWSKLGPLAFKTTPKPSDMFRYQAKEGRSIVAQYCDLRLTAIRRVRNNILNKLLAEDIVYYQAAVATLCEQDAELEKMQQEYRKRLGSSSDELKNPELHDCDACISVWNEQYLTEHLNYYCDENRCAEEVNRTVDACEEFFERMVTNARALSENVPGNRNKTRAAALMNEISRLSSGFLWEQSARIHDALERQVGTKKYKRAYADNIYEYLADKDDQFLDTLTEQLMVKVMGSAKISAGTATGGPMVAAIDVQQGPCKAACLGLKSADDMNSMPARESYRKIKNRLADKLTRKANDQRYHEYEHSDGREIRITYTEYFMPLRFFTVTRHVEERYNAARANNEYVALYFSNIDDNGMLSPCPDRSDLTPDLDINKVARKEYDEKDIANTGAASAAMPVQVQSQTTASVYEDVGAWNIKPQGQQPEAIE